MNLLFLPSDSLHLNIDEILLRILKDKCFRLPDSLFIDSLFYAADRVLAVFGFELGVNLAHSVLCKLIL